MKFKMKLALGVLFAMFSAVSNAVAGSYACTGDFPKFFFNVSMNESVIGAKQRFKSFILQTGAKNKITAVFMYENKLTDPKAKAINILSNNINNMDFVKLNDVSFSFNYVYKDLSDREDKKVSFVVKVDLQITGLGNARIDYSSGSGKGSTFAFPISCIPFSS